MHKTFKIMSIVSLKQYNKTPCRMSHYTVKNAALLFFFLHTSSVSPNSFTVKMTQQDCETLGFLSFRKLPHQRQQKLLIVKHIFAKNVELRFSIVHFTLVFTSSFDASRTHLAYFSLRLPTSFMFFKPDRQQGLVVRPNQMLFLFQGHPLMSM